MGIQLSIQLSLRPVSMLSFTTRFTKRHISLSRMKQWMKLDFTMQCFISPIPKLSKAFNCYKIMGSYASIDYVAIHTQKHPYSSNPQDVLCKPSVYQSHPRWSSVTSRGETCLIMIWAAAFIYNLSAKSQWKLGPNQPFLQNQQNGSYKYGMLSVF